MPSLLAKIETFAPRLLAFTSKNAARAALGRSIACYGLQPECLGPSRVFVLPSPSGQARGHWDIAPWRRLAALTRELSEAQGSTQSKRTSGDTSAS